MPGFIPLDLQITHTQKQPRWASSGTQTAEVGLVASHRNRILAYYDYPISTGPLEGTNTKIRVMQRQAYGFRDTQFFKLKIYALHESSLELIGGGFN
jgi:transposase